MNDCKNIYDWGSKNHPELACIGESSNDVDLRIIQEGKKAMPLAIHKDFPCRTNITKNELYEKRHEWKVPAFGKKCGVDKEIHKILKNSGYVQALDVNGNKTEFFYANINDIELAIQTYKDHKTSFKKCDKNQAVKTPTSWQEEGIKNLQRIFRYNKLSAIVNYVTGAGKTFTVESAFNRAEFGIMIIRSYIPSVLIEWMDEFYGNYGFNFKAHNLYGLHGANLQKEIDIIKKEIENGYKVMICLSSYSTKENAIRTKDEIKKLLDYFDNNNLFYKIVNDEAHKGSFREVDDSDDEEIDYPFNKNMSVIDVTATPFPNKSKRAELNKAYDIVCDFSMQDIYELKNDSVKFATLDNYSKNFINNFPQLRCIMPDHKSYIAAKIKDGFTGSSSEFWISGNKDSQRLYIMSQFGADVCVDNDIDCCYQNFFIKKYNQAVMVRLNTRIACDNYEAAFKQAIADLNEKWEIRQLHSPSDVETIKNQYKDGFYKDKNVLLISCGSGTVGLNFPLLTRAIFECKVESLIVFFQTAGRLLRAFPGKKDVVCYCAEENIIFNLLYKEASVSNYNKQEAKERFETMCKLLVTSIYDSSKGKEVDVITDLIDKKFEELLKEENEKINLTISGGFLNFDGIDSNFLKPLLKNKGSNKNSVDKKAELATHGDTLPSSGKKQSEGAHLTEKDSNNKDRKLIIATKDLIFTWIKWSKEVCNCDTIEEAYNSKDAMNFLQKLFEEYEIDIIENLDYFKNIFTDKINDVFNVTYKMNYSYIGSVSSSYSKDLLELFEKRMSKNSNICGVLGLGIRGIELCINKYKKCSAYFYESEIEKMIVAQQCKELGINIEFIEYKVSQKGVIILDTMKKFDLIIMNPPYNTKSGLHAVLAAKAMQYSNIVISLMPDKFFTTNNLHEKFRNDYKSSIYDYEKILDMKKLFNISYENGAIFTLIKDKGKIDYDSKMSKALELQKKLLNNKKFREGLSLNLVKYVKQEYFIPVGTHGENILTEYSTVIHGFTKDGKNYKEIIDFLFNSGKDYQNNCGLGVAFKSEKNMNDFIMLTRFKIVRNILIATKAGTSSIWRHDLKFFKLPKNLNCTEEEYIKEMGLQSLKNEIEQLAQDAKKFKLEKN